MPLSAQAALLAVGGGPMPEADLAGAYRWGNGGFVDVQRWDEMGPEALVAFDDSGWIRVLTPADGGFTVGPSIGQPEPVAARVRFEVPVEGPAATLVLVWETQGAGARVARRAEDHRAEPIAFANGEVRLSGSLLLPPDRGRHPALVLLHGSNVQDRNSVLPFARFLVRHGIALLTYDKRGVGGSSGDWRRAGFDDLAADALAAVALLKSRPEIDAKRIGLLGVSQGGWIGPLAAFRSSDVALVVSVSGPSVTPVQQTLDLIEGEMRLEGFADSDIEEATALARLSFDYAQAGEGWERYAAAWKRSRERSWLPYLGLAAEKDAWQWGFWRRVADYDPATALVTLRCPVLAILGGRDSGIPAEKNRSRWQQFLAQGGVHGHSVVVLPQANHLQLEARTSSLFELGGLDRFVPEYRKTLLDWLRERFPLLPASP